MINANKTPKRAKIDIPRSWIEAAERIYSQGRRVMILGTTDVGKSTLLLFLTRYLTARGAKVAIIDADIGQKDLGPPATITSTTTGKPPRKIRELPIERLYFVGSVTPLGHLLPMVVGSKILLEACRADFYLINTTGLITGRGRRLKSFKIELLRPDTIVALERERELEPILRAHPWPRRIRLKPSQQARPKTREIRSRFRQKAFQEYFSRARTIVFDLPQLVIDTSLLFTGRRIDTPGAVWSEKTSEGLLVVSERRLPGRIKHIFPQAFVNLLCGLYDKKGLCQGLGIVKKIDFVARQITLFTPVGKRDIYLLQPGSLYLSPEGKELGRHQVHL
ncbi:hypothetical protein G4V39_07375 [Thermosulfuriphilus ammonigenes]|uniref:Clp1 P-loop domain-containing protein n=1 Tax=Thermosulfuriphilus ammonigenes TaxID=1936021 RepID=A0A6G7PWY4_9BACT|nr:Clp1/GlmU family protein [Thermosulfuriphilus ammonigenes]MBA2847695.1 polynucleotide 5'-hydroxyl-kinase GRC3/NOL9 [Thermosulfuriphilus ammonigenes]QIJ72097.1 hypothetical protein G4V39_07375 [Thermosulfuriphilus ammonigenes]